MKTNTPVIPNQISVIESDVQEQMAQSILFLMQWICQNAIKLPFP